MELDPDIPREELVLLEAYYAGELTAEQVDDLRRRLDRDPDLRSLAAEHERVLRYGLQPDAEDLSERQRLRAELAREEAEHSPLEDEIREPARRRRFPTWWAAAAVILLAGAVWLLSSPAEEGRLARESLVWVPREAMTLGPESSSEKALTAYDTKAYDRAFPGIVEGVASGQLDSINLLYAGISAIAIGDPAAAREVLAELERSGAYGDYAGEIRYNLGLAELELGAYRKAADHLKASLAAGYAPAEKLLQQLEDRRNADR